jgi:hypothetical protein
MSNNYLTLSKSTTNDVPSSILFGELKISEIASNSLKVYCGDSTNSPVKIYDETVSPTPTFIYNNPVEKYVCVQGSNSNNGQSGRPYATITYGISQLSNSSQGILSLEGGNYIGNITLTESDSKKGIIGTSSSFGFDNNTYITGNITINSNDNTISNIKLSGATSKIILNGSSDTRLDNIIISNSITGANVIESTSITGYLRISNCDFNNKTLLLTSDDPMIVYIDNCKNLKLNLSNKIVCYSINTVFQEISTNNNIYNGFNVITDIISSAPTNPGFYILSADYLTFLKGSLIAFDGLNITLLSKYYNCQPYFYVFLKNATYVKTSNSEFAEVQIKPIIL